MLEEECAEPGHMNERKKTGKYALENELHNTKRHAKGIHNFVPYAIYRLRDTSSSTPSVIVY